MKLGNIIKNKINYLEFLRIIACLLVVVNHTNSRIFQASNPNSITWWISVTMYVISKAAVPIFFMISGITLLKKEESIKELYKKRVSKILIITILVSFIYYLNLNLTINLNPFSLNLKKISILKFFETIYQKPIIIPFWYLYDYLAFLMLLPILRKLVKSLTDNEFKYTFILFIIFGSVLTLLPSYIPSVSKYTNYFIINLFDSTIIYAFLGYYLEYIYSKNKLKKFDSKLLIAIYIISIAFGTLLIYQQYKMGVVKYNALLDELSHPVVITTTFTIFVLFKNKFNLKNNPKIITYLSSLTLGIYLFHSLFIDRYRELIYNNLNEKIVCFAAMIIFQSAVVLSASLVTAILKKIKYINKLI